MKFMEKAKRFFTLNAAKHEGFTLVELIVVIAILAILAGVAVPAYSGYIKKAEKAGDMQLLAAVNEAFAAACMSEGTQAILVNSATLTWDNDCIKGIATVNGAYDAGIDAAFKMFYAGNDNTAFKALANKLFFANGVFGEGDGVLVNVFNSIIGNEAYAGSIAALQGSAFAGIGAESLLGQVDGVANLAAAMLGTDGSTLYGIVFDENGDYLNNLLGTLNMTSEQFEEKMGAMSAEEQAKFLANSTIISVAQTMNDSSKIDMDEMKELFTTANFGAIGTEINTGDADVGLAQAAMLYGLYTAYAPEEAAKLNDLNSVDSLIALKDDTGFKTYLAGLNDPNSQASKDLDGYVSALDIVNGAVTESPDAANQIMSGGYVNSDLQAMLQQVMGK